MHRALNIEMDSLVRMNEVRDYSGGGGVHLAVCDLPADRAMANHYQTPLDSRQKTINYNISQKIF